MMSEAATQVGVEGCLGSCNVCVVNSCACQRYCCACGNKEDFFSNSEVFASELLENLEEIFLYYW